MIDRDETPPPAPITVSREEFVRSRWRYKDGEHVSFLGPTGAGKTTLAMQLLRRSATPQRPAVMLAMKPRDATTTAWAKQLGWRVVRDWPAPGQLWTRKPSGYVVWPKHSFDPDRDDPMLYRVFRRTILDCYRRGGRILYADEVHGLTDELRLTRELVTVWSRGRSMGCGLWGGTQRPAQVPLWMYSQAHHLFLANDPDARSRERFGEIGGIDPSFVRRVVRRLRPHQWLYLRREGNRYCIVDA